MQIKNSETTLAIYVTEYQPLWYRNRSSNTQQRQRRVVKQRNEINCLKHLKGCSTSMKPWYTCILPNAKSPKSCQIYAFGHCLQMQNYVIHGKLIWVKIFKRNIRELIWQECVVQEWAPESESSAPTRKSSLVGQTSCNLLSRRYTHACSAGHVNKHIHMWTHPKDR